MYLAHSGTNRGLVFLTFCFSTSYLLQTLAAESSFTGQDTNLILAYYQVAH